MLTFAILHDLRISTLYSDFDSFYAFSYYKVNSYFRTITILVQDNEKFHFNQSFATLGRPYLLYYMTFEFQPYITLAISKFLCKENAGAILKPLLS